MPIYFHTEDIRFQLKEKRRLKSWLKAEIGFAGQALGDLNFIFCNDDYLLNINNKYLSHNYYTDIVTFDYCEENTISGDLFISVDRVRDNSEKLGVDFSSELHRVMIHGVLHLLGYKDKSKVDRADIRGRESSALERLEKI